MPDRRLTPVAAHSGPTRPILPIERQSTPNSPSLSYSGTSAAGPRSAEARSKSSLLCSGMQADSLGRRRTAFRPQAGKALVSQVSQYPLDHRRVFSAGGNARAVCPQGKKTWSGAVARAGANARAVCLQGKKPWSEAVARASDDLDRAPAFRTGLHVDLKHPLETLRPAHRRPLLGRCAIFCWSRPQRLSAPASPVWRDPGPVRADRFSFIGFFRLCRKPPLTQTGADCWARTPH